MIRPSKRLVAVSVALAFGFGVWTIAAVDFADVATDFEEGDTLSASEFNTLFGGIQENFEQAAEALAEQADELAGLESALEHKLEEDQPDSISTEMLQDGSVTLAKIDAAGADEGDSPVFDGDELVWNAPAPGWSLTGNAGTDPAENYLGTTDDAPLEVRVNDERALRIEPGSSPNLVGGHGANEVAGGIVGAAIGGGGTAENPNTVAADFGTIGGGENNEVTGEHATIAGGQGNEASGLDSAVGGGNANTASAGQATVAGGVINAASAVNATVSGGVGNVASGFASVVSGGNSNLASGDQSIVAGGLLNEAGGFLSFAAGTLAAANHNGSFVWADCGDSDCADQAEFASSTENQFNVRARGGTRIFSNGPATTGVILAAGANDWSSASDEALKENFTELDKREVLQRLSQMPITEWNMKGQDATVRHIGPTAQNFAEAFGLGSSTRYINNSDARGVALVSIQALHELVLEKDRQIVELREELAALRQSHGELASRLEARDREVEQLDARMARLEALLSAQTVPDLDDR